jgi:hypothetical protein
LLADSSKACLALRLNLKGLVREGGTNLILSEFCFYHLVYVDDSGSDNRTGFRRKRWASLGVIPVQTTGFHRSARHQILPAYAQDGIMHVRIFQGSTDSMVFEDFVQELLPLCGRWPEPKSVLVMDNTSFHQPERVEQLCADAGVKVLSLPPYSPDLNPMEEFFAELKALIRRSWPLHLCHGRCHYTAAVTTITSL